MTGIVTDLAPHPYVHFAVVIDGELLPVRFSRREEAVAHLAAIVEARATASGRELTGAAA